MELNDFSGSLNEELMVIIKLIYDAKYKRALSLIEVFEEKVDSLTKEELICLILKGKIHCYTGNYKKAIEVGNHAYPLSRKLGCIVETIEALFIKAFTVYFGNIDEATNNILEAEKLLKSIDSNPSQQIAEILLMKAIICRHKDDLNESLELATQCLNLLEKSGGKLDISRVYYLLGEINLYQGNSSKGLSYGQKSLQIQKELDNKVGIAMSLSLMGMSYYTKGDFEQALKLGKQSLLIREMDVLSKIEVLNMLAGIYRNRGELSRALRYYNRTIKLAEEEGYIEEIITINYLIGSVYRAKGEFNKAIRSFQRSLDLSEKYNSIYGMQSSLFHLILTFLDNNSPIEAKKYLEKLEQLTEKTESKVFKNAYLIAKALILKKGGRIRYRTEAELILKQIIEKGIETPILYHLSFVNLCELFLEELSITNNIEVLDELNPLINRLLIFSEKQNAYLWLAETKLLKAKLALIQMNFDKAKQILTEAQRIAEIHHLKMLASKISSEHDKLLDQMNIWDDLKRIDAPMSKLIELAAFEGVVDRMQGKKAVEVPKLTPEVPILLLIIGEGGLPLFTTQFGDDIEIEEEIVGGFLTAFNDFSGEIFSKGLDRAKFGDYLLLMERVNIFSVGYFFKGQTYLAKQKLAKFTERIQSTTPIWESLIKFDKSNRLLELKDIPDLEIAINEIFLG